MPLAIDKSTQKIVTLSALGGASAYFLTSVPVAGGVIFGASAFAAGGILRSVLNYEGSSMQKVAAAAIHIFITLSAAWGVTSLLIGAMSLKATAILGGGIIGGIFLIEVISKFTTETLRSSFG